MGRGSVIDSVTNCHRVRMLSGFDPGLVTDYPIPFHSRSVPLYFTSNKLLRSMNKRFVGASSGAMPES
jgi:hypothetical protein